MKKLIAAMTVATLASLTFALEPKADAATHHEAPIGYTYEVTTKAGYHFHNLKHEDSPAPGVWNAAVRGNGDGVSFVATKRSGRIYLGLSDRKQGSDDPNGVVAWKKHRDLHPHNEVIYRRYGYIAEVDTTLDVGKRRLYVIANAVWK